MSSTTIVLTSMAIIHVHSDTLDYICDDDISVVMKEGSTYNITPSVHTSDMMRDENDNPLYLEVWVDLGTDVLMEDVQNIINDFEVVCESEPHMHFTIEDSGINEE